MSGVLDRLAKLAVGALPTVQPLLATKYAARSSELRQNAFEPEAQHEIDAPAAFPRTTARNAPQTGVPATARPGHQPDHAAAWSATSTGALAPQQPRPATTSALVDVPIKQSPPAATLEARTRNRQYPAQETEPASSEHAQEPPHEPAERVRSHAQLMSAAGPAISREAPSSVSHEAEISDPSSHPAAIADELQPAPRLAAERMAREIQPSPAASRNSAKHPESAAAMPEQRTEIHISIGSIEVRAPRSESKPPAPPFRPRVTLDDFLRRKPEAGV